MEILCSFKKRFFLKTTRFANSALDEFLVQISFKDY